MQTLLLLQEICLSVQLLIINTVIDYHEQKLTTLHTMHYEQRLNQGLK